MSSNLSILFSNLSSKSSSQFGTIAAANTDDELARFQIGQLSRVRIQLTIDPDSEISADDIVAKLAERYVPGVPQFIITEGNILVLRLRHVGIRVLQTDQLTCRLARLKGVINVDAEQRRTGQGVIYSARMRGR